MRIRALPLFVFVLIVSSALPLRAEPIQMLPPVQSDDTTKACKDTEGNKLLSWDGKTSIKCNKNVTIDSSSNMGIGVATPKAKLDVAGGVKLANDAAACTAAKSGTVRWTGSKLMVCVGATSTWTSIPINTPYLVVGGIERVYQDGTGTFGYCRLGWGAIDKCNAAETTCSVGVPVQTSMLHDEVGAGEDMSAGKFISSGGKGAHVGHFECVLTVS